MPLYTKGDHQVNVSGEKEIARFRAAGYSPSEAAKPSEKTDKPAKKAAAKPSEK